jgi:hypothetical protein
MKILFIGGTGNISSDCAALLHRRGHETRAGGDGTWGQLHDAYFLAEGDTAELNAVFASVEPKFGKPIFGNQGSKLAPIGDKPVPASVLKALRNPPRSEPTKDKP